MKTANETAEQNIRPVRGIYLMTDIYGNQRRVKISPAEKSMLLELQEPRPTKKTCKAYDSFLYGKGTCRVKYNGIDKILYWDNGSFKIYPQDGVEPLYFELESKA